MWGGDLNLSTNPAMRAVIGPECRESSTQGGYLEADTPVQPLPLSIRATTDPGDGDKIDDVWQPTIIQPNPPARINNSPYSDHMIYESFL